MLEIYEVGSLERDELDAGWLISQQNGRAWNARDAATNGRSLMHRFGAVFRYVPFHSEREQKEHSGTTPCQTLQSALHFWADDLYIFNCYRE